MKIREIQIEGFGLFNNKKIGPLEDGLVIFQGKNEAGKSTILSFIRAIFFGFSNNRKENRPSYLPIKTGPYGGRIIIEDKKGERFLFERLSYFNGKSIKKTNFKLLRLGSEPGLFDPKMIFGGITQKVYENIFAFSLKELQELDSLNEEGVKDAIYGVGFGTSFMALSRAQKFLEKGLDELFRPRGKKQKINRTISKIKKIKKELSGSGHEIEKYREMKEQIALKEKELESLENMRTQTEKDLYWHKTLREGWNDFLRFKEIERGLLEERINYQFPDDETFFKANETNEKLNDLDDQIKGLKEKRTEIEIAISKTHVKSEVIKNKQKIKEISSLKERYIFLREEIPLRTRKNEKIGRKIKEIENKIGKAFDKEELKNFKVGIHTEEKIEEYNKGLKRVNEDFLEIIKRYEIRVEDLSQLNETIKKLEKDLKEGPVELKRRLSEIDNQLKRLSRIENDLFRRKELSERINGLKNELKGLQKRFKIDVSICDIFSIDEISKGGNEILERLDSLKKELLFLKSILAQIKKDEDTHKARIKRRQERLDELNTSLPVDKDKKEELIRLCSGLKIGLPRISSIKSQKNQLEIQIDTHENRLKEGFHFQKRLLFFKYLNYLIPFLGLFALISGFSLKDSDEGIRIFLYSLLPVSIFLFLFFRKRIKKALKGLEESLRSTKRKIASLSKETDFLNSLLENIVKDAHRLSMLFGLSHEDYDEPYYSGLLNRIEEIISVLREEEKIKKEMKTLNEDLEDIILRKEETELSIRRVKEKERILEDRWKDFLKENSLDEQLKKEDFYELTKGFNLIKEKVIRLKELKKELERIDNGIKKGLEFFKRPIVTKDTKALRDLVLEIREDLIKGSQEVKERLLKAQRLKALKEEKEGLESEITDLDKKKEEISQKINKETQNWQVFLKKTGLPFFISPDIAIQYIKLIEELRKLIDEKEQEQEILKEYRAEKSSIERSLKDILSRLFADERPKVNEGIFDILENLLQREEQKITNLLILKEKLKAVDDGLKNLTQKRHSLLAQLKSTFDEFHVKDLNSLKKRYEKGKFLERLKKEQEAILIRLSSGLGVSEKEAIEIYSRTNLPEIESKINELNRQAEDIKRKIEEKHQEIGRCREVIKGFMTSDKRQELLFRKEALENELFELSRRWARLKISQIILKRAKERFERENQPKVLEIASTYFSTITNGRYERILFRAGEDEKRQKAQIFVMRRDGMLVSPQNLSQGTKEQLYLSLRFGIISTLEPEGETIPVIMDDIMVNFDPQRTRLAARAIGEFSQKRQILFFTCHPHVTDALLKEVSYVQLIDL